MAKKKLKKVKSFEIEVKIPAETPPIEEKPKLSPFNLEFGREDLNMLRDKLNKVIEFVNK